MTHKLWKLLPVVVALFIAPMAMAGVMVTEVTGKVELVGKGPVSLLSQIPDGSKLQVAAGANLVVVDMSSGREFALPGGTAYLMAATGPTTADGKAVAAKSLPSNNLKDVRVAPGKLAQATLVMRGLQSDRLPVLVSPMRTAVVTVLPELQWEAVGAATSYRLELTKLDGSLAWETTTTKTVVTVPQSHALEPGERYSWRVAAMGQSAKLSDSSGRFSVASKEFMDSLNLLAPGPDASFSRKVLYATQLQEAGAVQQAKDLWKTLASERPEDQTLAELAK
jgi:hypothetical protein